MWCNFRLSKMVHPIKQLVLKSCGSTSILWNESNNFWPSVDIKRGKRNHDLRHKRETYPLPSLYPVLQHPQHSSIAYRALQSPPVQSLHSPPGMPAKKLTQLHMQLQWPSQLLPLPPNYCTEHVLSFSVISRHFSEKLCDYSFVSWPDGTP